MLEFRTFGAIDVRISGGKRVTALLDQPKRLALLAVLSARSPDELLRRQELVSLLWPDCSPSSGRSSLSTTLSRLRRDLGEELFRGRRTETVGLSSEHFRSDAQQFLEAMDEDRPRRGVELYRGRFLEGFHLPGNRAFERWLEERRLQFRRDAYRAALRAGEEARAEGELEAAEDLFRRAVEIHPVREAGAAGLIRVLAERGHESDAIQVHRQFQERRSEQLDLPPSDDLRSLIDRIRSPARASGASEPSRGEPGTGHAASDPQGPEGESTGSPPPEADEGQASRVLRRLPGRVAATLALALVAVGAIGAWTLLTPEAAGPTSSERSVAVLPFHVAGSADRSWEDGLVTVLSHSLDGVEGLRAIADRTVLATWERVGSARAGASREDALSVARDLRADYAVVGSVVELGSMLRFTADLLHAGSGRSLGHVSVRAPADSAAVVADEMSRRVIGLVEERTDESVRRAEAASLNTNSVEALKAYLEGERHLRAGEADAAMAAFQQAIRADSAFALPYARLGLYGFWRDEDEGRATRRAYEVSGSLPLRDRRLIRALYLGQIEHRTVVAADSLRVLSREYPDDPSVWSSLGEFVFHTNIAGGLPEIEDAHERAVTLDPGHTAYYDHYLGPAFTLHHDSSLATTRVEAMPDSEWKRMYRLGLDLVFGGASVRESAFERLDSTRIHEPWLAFGPLEGPTEKDRLDRLLRRLLRRDDLARDPFAPLVFVNDLHRGQVRRARADVERLELPPGLAACYFAHMLTLGYPIPDSVARPHLAPGNLPASPSLARLKCTALYMIEEGHGDRLEGLIERMRSTADHSGESGVPTYELEAVVQELRGYRAWREGDLERAARLLGRSNESFNAGAIWRGDLYRQLGRRERAEGWYRAAWRHPLSYQRLGRLYEEAGETGRAVTSYRRFIAAWDDADDGLQTHVARARDRLRELDREGQRGRDAPASRVLQDAEPERL